MRLLAGLIVATALVLAALVVAGRATYDDHRDSRDRTAAQTVARSAVHTLITVSADRAAQLEDIEPSLTGSFLKQFRSMYSTFTSVLTQGKVTSRGTVQAAAVSSLGSGQAQVLVAAHAEVSSPTTKTTARDYRFKVELRRVGGTWRISGMGLVP